MISPQCGAILIVRKEVSAGGKAVRMMSGFNDRRTGEDRRRGDRRWLGSFMEKKDIYADKRNRDRRFCDERRDPKSIYTKICF